MKNQTQVPKKFWNWKKVKNQETEVTERILELNGTIAEESWFDDDVTPQVFKDELNSGTGDITVWINSPGGDCVAAAQIYNMLSNYKGKVTVKIDGIAASAASVIAMAGDTVLMSPVSMLMIHNPATIAWGDHAEMQKAIDMLSEVKESIGSGKVRKIVYESSAATETYLAHQLPDKANALATPVGLLILLLVFDWRLGLLSLLPVAAAFIIMSVMTGKRMAKKMEEYNNALGQMSNEAVEYVRGISVVKTFGQSVFSFRRFKEAIDNYEKWVIAYTKDLRFPMMCYTTLVNGIFAVLIAAALMMTSGGVTNEFLLNLMYYIIITPVITLTLTKIMYASENKLIVADAMSRIDSILEMQPLPETKNPKRPKDNSVELSGVSFRYKDAGRNALENISLTIKSGEHIAFVGPSGGGKTTLASIVARFWDVENGSVKIGGINVKDISKEELMDTVSFVFQDSRLLKTSILENVRMAKPGASREEILKALHDAQCDDILEKLPNGVDTVVGAKGVYLSGGEQQRISIARVMLKNAPVLILDEATAFADPDNEAKVQAAFSVLAKGKTVLMIAHRLSTVTGADRIVVIKDGKIADTGTHAQLKDKDGLYAEMWRQYNKAAKWKVGVSNA